MAYDGILTISSQDVAVFVKKLWIFDIEWNGQYIGRIDHLANRVSSTCTSLVFYCNRGFFFMLEKYDEFSHYIEILKCLFDLPLRPFNICKYRCRKYFMFLTFPDNENEFKISKYKPFEISDGQRLIGIFHWILGVKGKMWRYKDNQEYIFMSRGPYEFDYDKYDFKKIELAKYLPDLETKYKFHLFFSQPDKLNMISEFLSDNGMRNWFNEITKKIRILSCC